MQLHAVLFTPAAERQLANLYAYIAEDRGTAIADKFIGGVVESCMALAAFPRVGAKRDDIRPDLRIKTYARRVTIAFSIDAETETVAILGVFYGGQDFELALRESETGA
jgi:plasmid stabilization system protein ParE